MSFSGFPGPSGSGSCSVSPWYDDALAPQRHPDDVEVLARPLQLLAEPLPVPALGDLRPGGAQSEDHAPARELVERRGGHRRHRRAAAGDLEDAGSELDP